jgi:hypothetical protein
MTPTEPDATVNLPLSRADMAILNPSPSFPNRFSSGTFTSFNAILPVLPALTPNFPCKVEVFTPLKFFSTINALIPLCFFDLSV